MLNEESLCRFGEFPDGAEGPIDVPPLRLENVRNGCSEANDDKVMEAMSLPAASISSRNRPMA